MSRLELRQTCPASPEQYDAYLGKTKVAYFRLRWGIFRVDMPTVGGDTVYKVHLDDEGWQGEFYSEEERDRYLTEACAIVLAKLGKRSNQTNYVITKEELTQ